MNPAIIRLLHCLYTRGLMTEMEYILTKIGHVIEQVGLSTDFVKVLEFLKGYLENVFFFFCYFRSSKIQGRKYRAKTKQGAHCKQNYGFTPKH